ncbi:hypothetical protein HanIR_Chr09g0400911 [Helianthus annuus]|nr:hypothetical protein HanIR_Chr09g0400911 [Helianthus annuus]
MFPTQTLLNNHIIIYTKTVTILSINTNFGWFSYLLPIKDIIGPEWKISKQGTSPCQTLVVWVPKKTGFTEFVKVNQENKVEGGFSIAIFCYALHFLPFRVQPIFKPFINDKGESNGTYDQLLRHIEGKVCYTKQYL